METGVMKYSPEKIVEILHSVKKFSVKDGELDTWFQDSQYPEGIRGFIPGSFTRELLELIERHLLDDTGEGDPGLGQEQEADSGQA
jgi:hypothetical protein